MKRLMDWLKRRAGLRHLRALVEAVTGTKRRMYAAGYASAVRRLRQGSTVKVLTGALDDLPKDDAFFEGARAALADWEARP